jgi:hypothetical protein
MANHKKVPYPIGYYPVVVTSKPIDASAMHDSSPTYYAYVTIHTIVSHH